LIEIIGFEFEDMPKRRNITSIITGIETTISFVEEYHYRIDWLNKLRLNISSVINLGCDKGNETIALMWFLNASEVIGIDNDHYDIYWACDEIETFQANIKDLSRKLASDESIPDHIYAKGTALVSKYSNRPLPSFLHSDVTARIDSPSCKFDLAYCERFMCHIACINDNQVDEESVIVALSEIYRVLKPNGLFVAIEPRSCTRDRAMALDFGSLFDQSSFIRFACDRSRFSCEGKRVYCYQKPVRT
jgi:SAM-dependent methyltransferase